MDVRGLVSERVTTLADYRSVAEITSGIVCGCLITMPNFFRHVAPKIASKLHSSKKNSSLNKFASIVSSRSHKSVPQWHDRYDLSPRHSEYLELGEDNVWHSPAKAGAVAGNGPIPPNAVWKGPKASGSGADLESGITKTVKVEQYSRFPIT